ncbi:MAG: hypothetical protein ACTSXH_03225 [Promethearchaeota archaeon]
MNQEEEDNEESDYQKYIIEMEQLKTDFSDLEALDIEEIQEIQEAIEQVKKMNEKPRNGEKDAIKLDQEAKRGYQTDLIADFSDLGKIDLDELREMKEAIELVKQEEMNEEAKEKSVSTKSEAKTLIEKKIEEELKKREKRVEKEERTPEQFLKYLKNKRNKIYYNALYYLTFNVEDHVASKELLYEMLKEKVSKSPIDPIEKHKFYFGLGHLLKLEINGVRVIQYMLGGKFKINVDVNLLKDILKKVGEPIDTRPVIKEEEKKKMFKEFLQEDFSDFI